MIELKNFSKSYSKKAPFAVTDVSIQVPDGSITGLIGPNGSGKSTILKAICGIHYPTKGEILVTSTKTSANSTPEQKSTFPVSNNFGYVPETPFLPPEMTVESFLNYAGEIHGLFDNTLSTAKERVIKDCSLESFLSKKIKTLSKGQKQRVSFAQALIHDPKNLILDEIISGLDPAQILQMRQLILHLSKTKAILMSTHILQEINSLCTNLYILNEGKIVAQGTESQILKTHNVATLEECFIKLTTRSDS